MPPTPSHVVCRGPSPIGRGCAGDPPILAPRYGGAEHVVYFRVFREDDARCNWDCFFALPPQRV